MQLRVAPLLASLCLLPACGGPSPDAGGPPSVVVVVVDTLRADHLGCYGYDRATSPRLDALAAEGLLFERCVAQSTWTKPAAATLLTGLPPALHGANHVYSALDERHVTLAELARGAGLATAAFGFNGYLFDEGTGFEQGFATFEGAPREGFAYARGEAVVDRAVAWLEREAGEAPFLLYVHLFDPHMPYDPPTPFRERFDRGYDGPIDGYVQVEEQATPDELGPDDWRHLVDLYDGEVAYADAQLGRLLDALERLGRAEDALVVVTSDHGEELGDHGGWSHEARMYDEILRVPLVVRPPASAGLPRGARIAATARQLDLVPTVCDALGIAPPEGAEGTSLLALAAGDAPPPAVAISETRRLGHLVEAVEIDRRRYVRRRTPEETERLHDLRSDPREREDLLAAEPAAADAHRAALRDHLARVPGRYALEVENGTGELLRVAGFLAGAAGEVAASELLGCEIAESDDRAAWPEDWDGPWQLVAVDLDERPVTATRFHFRTAPGDRDGLLFAPAPGETTVRVALAVDGHAIDPARVELGPAPEHPPAIPFDLPLDDPGRWLAPDAGAGGSGAPAPGWRIRIRRVPDVPTAELRPSAETLEALRAVGYLGD